MTVRDILNKFQQEKENILNIRKKNVEQAQGWLNNEGRNVARAFKTEITSNQNWQCELDIEQFGQNSGRRFIKIHIHQNCRDNFNRIVGATNNVSIIIEHERENDDKYTVSVFDGITYLEPRKVPSSQINTQFLSDLLDMGLKTLHLDPLR